MPSRTINAPEDGWLDKDGKEPLRGLVEDGTDLPASSPASSAELFKAISAALALCTTVALRINKRGKNLHVEHEYGAEVAREFDAVDPLGEKGSADNMELKNKAIEKGHHNDLDDWLFISSSVRKAHLTTQQVLADVERAHGNINFKKSSLNPSSTITHMGFDLNTVDGTFFVPQKRWDALQLDIQSLLHGHRKRHKSPQPFVFAGFCRYNDLRVLRWEDVSFLSTFLEFRVVKRKNDQHRLCGKVRVAKMPGAVGCVYGLMRRYHAVMIRWATPTLPVFPGFSGTVLRHKGELGIVPASSPIEYPTFRRYLARWLGPLLTPAITEAVFLTRFATQSSRSGGASAAANADIPFATWGHHGGRKSTSAQLPYMGLDEEHVLSVSRAILTLAEEDELDDSDGDVAAGSMFRGCVKEYMQRGLMQFLQITTTLAYLPLSRLGGISEVAMSSF
eukprot:jgi/Tetstr1/436352/TSEL_025188.t1